MNHSNNNNTASPVILVVPRSQLPYLEWPDSPQMAAALDRIETDCFSGQLERKDLLQFLVHLQQRHGWIHPDAIQWCVDKLAATNAISHAEVHGIIDFYSFLERTPCPPLHLYLSSNVTDDFSGQADNLNYFQKLEAANPSRFKVTPTSCTGLCDQGPGALLNGFPIPTLNDTTRQLVTALVEGRIAAQEFESRCPTPADNIQRRAELLTADLVPGDGIRQALRRTPTAFLEEVRHSGLRGRGGAGFSTAFKWNSCREAEGSDKVIVCNADEGEPGTFKDRVLLHSHFEQVIDGMTIAAYTVGARHGFVYLRHEYQFLLPDLVASIQARHQQGLLGTDILGRAGFDFSIGIHLGAGAYVCGEESALLESMEGKRGIPRIRPPFPTQHGYLGQPTVVNNVETFCCVTRIALEGGEAFARQACQDSTGTKIHSVSGDCERPGLYELPFDATIEDLLKMAGAANTQAVQVGGPSGKLVFPRDFGRALNFSEVSSGGSFMVFDESRDLFAVVKNFTDFFHHESCGFCTPCRVGCGVLSEKLDKFNEAHASDDDIEHLREMMALMDVASHCGLGQTAAHPVRFLLQEKPDFFSSRTRKEVLKIDIREHTSAARQLTASAPADQPGVTSDDG